MNSNTPALVKKILGSSSTSTNESSTLQKQIFIIDSSNSAYTNNSPISITNIDVSYSQLGLLNPPQIISNKINIVETKSKTNFSILDTDLNLKNLYNYILSKLDKSKETNNIVSKETNLLLAIDSLIDFAYTISNSILINNKIIDNQDFLEINNLLSSISNVLINISKAIKYLNTLIGYSNITLNYAKKIILEISSSINIINSLSKSCNLQDKINNLLINTKQILNSDESTIPSFDYLSNCIDDLLKSIEIILNYFYEKTTFNKSISIIKHINYLKSNYSIIKNINSIVYLAYTNLNDNFFNISTNINLALDYSNDIKIINNQFNLTNNSKLNLYVKKLFSKSFCNENITNSKIENLNNPETITLLFSIYIDNLRISVAGLIGSDNFTGNIYYPNLYNLDFFGFNDIKLTLDITLPENISNLSSINHSDIKLDITSVNPTNLYNINNPSSFSADVTFSLTLDTNITITTNASILYLK